MCHAINPILLISVQLPYTMPMDGSTQIGNLVGDVKDLSAVLTDEKQT